MALVVGGCKAWVKKRGCCGERERRLFRACAPCMLLQEAILLFAVPFLSELKISWAFAAVPLHFQQQGWPLWGFGSTGTADPCAAARNQSWHRAHRSAPLLHPGETGECY